MYFSNNLYIVTPVLNAIETIDRTITSVITQAGRFFIRYHVQDGGSTDGTVERLHWWQDRLNKSDILLACDGIEFTFSSEPDNSMYDGLCKGFAYFDPQPKPSDFLSQINADDIYMQGAFAFINAVYEQFKPEEASWIGGAHSVMHDDFVLPSTAYECKLPTKVIANGLCEGIHWHFVQQEGVFFRYWLWRAINPNETIGTFKYAGDWNLWRMFAQQHVDFTQTPVALGSFRKSENQISSKYRDKYMLEIAQTISLENRLINFNNIIEKDLPLLRRKFGSIYSDKRLTINQEDCSTELSIKYKELHKHDIPEHIKLAKISKRIHTGNIEPEIYNDPITISSGIAVFDINWQYPAITEYHAYTTLKKLGGLPDGCLYIAFPWATLIDTVNTLSSREFVNRLKYFIQSLPPDNIRITVCQHIHLKKYLSLFVAAGIKHIFWSHATIEDKNTLYDGIQIHPFPLYPVQSVLEEKPSNEKKYLFSFIGARPSKGYLTRSRSWIIDNLHNANNALIIPRDGWHYQHIVYDVQITSTSLNSDLNDKLEHDAAVYRQSLDDSVFCLCPSGAGPNTIRLWEAIEAGCIPVIISDSHWLPGNRELWEKSVVFCNEAEDAVLALPDRLKILASDTETLNNMRNNLRQLSLLYGKHGFILDVLNLAYKIAKPKILSLKPKKPTKPIRIKLIGNNTNFLSINNPNLAQYYRDRLEFTNDINKADILLSGKDRDMIDAVSNNKISNQQPLVVLSDEPLWDYHAVSSQKIAKYIVNNIERTIISLNHNTTNIFSFSAIPYYILNINTLLIRYRALLSHDRCRTPQELLSFWNNSIIHTAFYMANRSNWLDPQNTETLIPLNAFRSDLATQVCRGNVIRVGKDWATTSGRNDLPDWHLDKLTNLYKKTHICSALENTITRHYISEKVFDVMAIGAIPIYATTPNHRIYDLLPNHAFIDIRDLSIQDNAAAIDNFSPDLEFCKRYVADQNKLFRLISNTSLLHMERVRVADEIITELSNLI